jgi:DNA processing protein
VSNVIDSGDGNWPKSLKELGRRTPDKIWYRGTWDKAIFNKCAAVIGTRRISDYGRRVVEKLIPELVSKGYTIVSGFMYGVDQAAHKRTLECGGRTIGVLGWGIDWKMTIRDEALAEQIIGGKGLIMSEWEQQKPMLWTFPSRNRIVAALCSDVYVVEAAIKSGALITVAEARSLNKNIWSVPGSVTSRLCDGTNWLIQQGMAKVWLPETQARNVQESIIESVKSITMKQKISSLLMIDTYTLDEIARKLKVEINKLSVEMSLLELAGLIAEEGGRYYWKGGSKC